MDTRPFLKQLFSVLFPPLCVACRRRIETGALCKDCENSIEIRSGFICPKCDRRLPEAKNTCHEEEKFLLAAATSYKNPAAKELIHALKYQGIKATLEPLTEIVNAYLQKVVSNLSLVISNCVIVPIPLHSKKEKERGFNQAALVAEILNKELGFEIQENNLIKTRKTNPQIKTKNYEERKGNVANCFAVKNPEIIAGRNVILVDDVFTSGATMREAVRVLKEAGAKKIIGFVIAKA